MPKKDDTIADTKVITKVEAYRLYADPSPRLKTHLDAAGKDILDAGNVECRTINGRAVDAPAKNLVDKEVERAEQSYARKAHGHHTDEIKGLRDLIDRLIQLAIPRDYAKDDHFHTFDAIDGTLDLDRIERGAELARLLARQLADEKHGHPELQGQINELLGTVKALQSDLTTARRDLASVAGEVTKAVEVLDAKIKAVAAAIPHPAPEKPVHVIGVKYAMIPPAANGWAIQTITTADIDGNPITTKATITRQGKPLGVGDTVRSGEVLHLPPNCLVCITLS